MIQKEHQSLYTPENCRIAYRLYWSLSAFANQQIPTADHWLQDLQHAVEKDGVRILEYKRRENFVHQFFLSTTPAVAPVTIVKSVKGRLQHCIRSTVPKAFQRNYSIKSVGPANSNTINEYVRTQLDHHVMADDRVQQRLACYQIHNADIDLSRARRSNYGEFIYNLHVVATHRERVMELRDDTLQRVSKAIEQTAANAGHLLSEGGILPDHNHLSLGCNMDETPMEVGLLYLNCMAEAHGSNHVFQSGFFVGTFGPFDLNSIRIGNNHFVSSG